MSMDKDSGMKVVKFSRKSTTLIISIWVGLLLSGLFVFLIQKRDNASLQAPPSLDEMIAYKETQLSHGVLTSFKAWAGSGSNPENTRVKMTFSEDKNYLTVDYSLSTVDYTSIALHQEYLTGHSFDGKYGRPFGNPYCDNYDGQLIYSFLNRLSWDDFERPTSGIFVNLNKYESEKITDKYGNSKKKVTKLSPAKFGISMSDLNKINWGGDGIDLKALSTLLPYSNPDVSWCDSELIYGALLNLD